MNRPDHSDKRPTVLIVEDSAALLEALESLLEEDGYFILTANSAEQALALLSTEPEPPALIIADQTLGTGMKGANLLETAISAHPEVRGILMSGAYQGCTKADPRFSILPKPFEPAQLLDLVSVLLH